MKRSWDGAIPVSTDKVDRGSFLRNCLYTYTYWHMFKKKKAGYIETYWGASLTKVLEDKGSSGKQTKE